MHAQACIGNNTRRYASSRGEGVREDGGCRPEGEREGSEQVCMLEHA
jgi:hypothetical protein